MIREPITLQAALVEIVRLRALVRRYACSANMWRCPVHNREFDAGGAYEGRGCGPGCTTSCFKVWEAPI